MAKSNECLREITEEDLPLILEWRNSERISKFMFTDQIITLEQHLGWFEDMQKQTRHKYLLYEYFGEAAGVVNFTNIDYRNHKCNWGFYIGKENLPVGTGNLMGQLAIKYAFDTLNMRKLCGEVLGFNERSVLFHQRLGFREEGRFKNHVLKNGRYTDVICYALFNESFNRYGDD